jgi:phospholipid/cholesterol/gamma-HCH transport system substrate-binding protein
MKNIVETLTGAIVLLIAFGFVYFAYKGANLKPARQGNHLIAKFDKADGIVVGSDIKISGIKIGTVSGQKLDADSFLAVIDLSIDKKIKLPIDTSIQIVSDGLLGGKYVSITPGSDDQYLENDGEIRYTQSSVNIETLIGKMIFNSADKDKTSQDASPQQ